MNEEMIREVLEETLKEMQAVNAGTAEMKARLISLETRFDAFGQLLKDQQIIIPPVDVEPVVGMLRTEAAEQRQQSADWVELVKAEMGKEVAAARAATVNIGQKVEEGIRLINSTVAAQPKPIVRQFRLVLFPGNDVEGAYKALAKLLAVIILFGVVAVGLYWGVEAIKSDFATTPVAPRQPATPSLAHGFDMHLETGPRNATPQAPVHRTPGLPANRIHGLTSEEARRQVDSMRQDRINRKLATLEAAILIYSYGEVLYK